MVVVVVIDESRETRVLMMKRKKRAVCKEPEQGICIVRPQQMGSCSFGRVPRFSAKGGWTVSCVNGARKEGANIENNGQGADVDADADAGADGLISK